MDSTTHQRIFIASQYIRGTVMPGARIPLQKSTVWMDQTSSGCVWCAVSRGRIFMIFFHGPANGGRYIQKVKRFVNTTCWPARVHVVSEGQCTAYTVYNNMAFLDQRLDGRVIWEGLWPPSVSWFIPFWQFFCGCTLGMPLTKHIFTPFPNRKAK